MLEKLYLLGFGDGGWAPLLLSAAAMTVLLSALGFMLGAIFGSLGAAGRLSKSRLGRGIALAYGTIFRGVPDLLTIYLLYYGGSVALTASPTPSVQRSLWGSPRLPPACWRSASSRAPIRPKSIAALSSPSPMASSTRPRRWASPAGRCCGWSLFRNCCATPCRGLSNVWQLVLKDSALISVIGLVELMRQTQIAAGSTREPFLFYTAAAALYFVIAGLTDQIFRKAEARTSRGIIHP